MTEITETPSFAKVIKDAIEARMGEINTILPGRFVSYDASKQIAQVQPLLKRKFADGTVVEPPVINNVPVVFPRAGNAYLVFPIAAGDGCLLCFSQRSLDVWRNKGGMVDPADPRKFAYSDAIAIPGLSPQTSTIPSPGTSVKLVNASAVIELLASGKFKITNGTDELIAVLVDLVTALIAARTATALGPQPLLGAEFPAIKAKLEGLKG